LGYWLLKQLLDVAYTDHIPIGAVPFIVSAILVLGALALTISTQVYKATSSNPVDALQGE